MSVIIVNYNVRHYLSQCLHSVFRALEGLEGEVIVVDNASSDGSVDMLQERFGEQITLIANPDNPGFAKANNQAMKVARGRYVLLLNPDTLVAEDTFRKCLNYMDKQPEAGGLGVYMQDGHGQFLPESKRGMPRPWVSFYKIFGLSKLFPRSKRFGQYHLTFLDKTETHNIEILSGAYMWMRKTALDKVGLLDETYFMYGEDIDLSWRLILGGYSNVYLADTHILHYKGESTKKGSLNYVKVFYQAMIIFAKRYFGGGNKTAFILAIRSGVYIRAFLAVMQRLLKRVGFPILEGSLIYGILYGVQAYWEHYVKYIEGGEYPTEFARIYLPAYAAIFVGLFALSGAYKRPFRLRPLLVAPVMGFVAIATGTYMFPFIQNFSRAIVGLGAVFTSLLGLGLRGLINWRENGQFFFTEPSRKRVLLTGDCREVDAIVSMIRSSLDYPVDIIGAACDDEPTQTQRLGNAHLLRDLIRLFRIDEVIFSNRNTSTKDLLQYQRLLAEEGLQMKILPPDDDVLIGPQTIITPQIGRGLKERIRSRTARRHKRIFDLVASALMILSFPFLFAAYRSVAGAFSALLCILRGQRTFVGYAQKPSSALPDIRLGYLSLTERINHAPRNVSIDELNRLYAREYRWEMDLEVLWKGWRNIGVH